MTLVLSAISPRWEMQASDRRFTEIDDDGKPVGYINEQNKAIFVAERLTFVYSGHAKIGGADTAAWFQARLAASLGRGMQLDEALDEVAAMLSEHLAALPRQVSDRGHSFVAVGWTEGSIAERAPLLSWISNCLDDAGEALTDNRESFQRGTRRLGPPEPFLIHSNGAPLNKDAWIRLNALVASQLEKSDEPEPIARTLIETIREQASVNESIGGGVMVNNLPRAPGPPDGNVTLVGKLPEADVRTFTYVPAESFAGRYLGPLVVTSDGSAFGDFSAEGPGVGFPDSGAGFVYRPRSSSPPPKAAVGQRIREFKIGRNDPCWCGSDKKYKKCHGR